MADEPKPTETKPSMPAQQPPEKPTTQLPAVPAWAIELKLMVQDGFAKSAANDNLITGELRRAQSDIRGLRADVTEIQEWKGKVEGTVMPRLDTHSIKVQQISDNDLSQQKDIADGIIKQTAFAAELEGFKKSLSSIEAKTDAQTAILTELRKVAANPMVRRVAYALGAALLVYLKARGIL